MKMSDDVALRLGKDEVFDQDVLNVLVCWVSGQWRVMRILLALGASQRDLLPDEVSKRPVGSTLKMTSQMIL